jgi:hypothetical protein
MIENSTHTYCTKGNKIKAVLLVPVGLFLVWKGFEINEILPMIMGGACFIMGVFWTFNEDFSRTIVCYEKGIIFYRGNPLIPYENIIGLAESESSTWYVSYIDPSDGMKKEFSFDPTISGYEDLVLKLKQISIKNRVNSMHSRNEKSYNKQRQADA